MNIEERFKILTEAAKYDVSCSSSGSDRSGKDGHIGSAFKSGICHSFTKDGRCISLLKILMSNACAYNCLYCQNRKENDIQRATLSPKELCEIVIGFYSRNFIEGLFLSSAIIGTPDFTMQKLLETVKLLREEYHFNGYIHLKGIPSASGELLKKAGLYADRMSFNVELPSEKSLTLLAPDKSKESIITPMKKMRDEIALNANANKKEKKIFLPAGQTSQVIVGASSEKDSQILKLTEAMYEKKYLKRMYYSAYSPIGTSSLLPAIGESLVRENRLYQADWLLRFYNFKADEIISENENLPLEFDPKCAYAIKNFDKYPIEVTTASLDDLLRIPGVGVTGAYKIINARKVSHLTFEGLKNMRIVLRRAKFFLTVNGKYYGNNICSKSQLKNILTMPAFKDNALQLKFDFAEEKLLKIGEF